MAETTEKAEPDTLLPCPFCGSGNAASVTPVGGSPGYWVKCGYCGAESDDVPTPWGAAKLWNTRAAPARCDAQSVRDETIEECAKVCDLHAEWASYSHRENEAPESSHNQLFATIGNTASACAGLIRALSKPAHGDSQT